MKLARRTRLLGRPSVARIRSLDRQPPIVICAGWRRWRQPPDSSLRAIGPDAVAAAPARAACDSVAREPAPDERPTRWSIPSSVAHARSSARISRLARSTGGRIRRRARQRRRDAVELAAACPMPAPRFADGINMRFLYDDAAQAVRRRLRGRRPARIHQPLRSAGQRMPPGESGRHRQGRRAGRTLVSRWRGPSPTRRRPAGLLSWSGTMFEYLMPLLFTRTFTNSLLDSACRDAVERRSNTATKTASRGAFPNRPTAPSTPIRSISTRLSACPLWP